MAVNSRRGFLGALASPAVLGCTPAAPPRLLRPATLPGTHASPQDAARDEDFWTEVQRAFTVDRAMINFNNGGVSPSPAIVQRAQREYLAFANQAPAKKMWGMLEPEKNTVRVGLARTFGVDPEEVALTRNASEGLQICQFGFDLERGDEVLTSDQDYPRMINTWKQRARRDGVVLKTVALPVPAEDPDE